MDRLVRHGPLAVGLLWLASASVPLAVVHFVGREEVRIGGSVHFAVVVVGALAATLAAVTVSLVGARLGDARAVLVGAAFSFMAALLTLHGLATPGVLMGENPLVSLTGASVLPLGGAVLALTALPALRRPASITPLLRLQAALLAGVLAVGAIGLLAPRALPATPPPGSTGAVALLALGLPFFAVLALRAARTFLLTRRGADLVVVVGVVWLGFALGPQLLLSFTDLGWWLGHGLELAGVVMIGASVAHDLRRGAASRALVGDLRAAELVAAEEAFLGPRVRALMLLLAEKDASTEHHTRSVAMWAVQVGEELGLAPGRLRELAIGGLLHDMGKLSVPDAILRKPGRLDDDELAIVRRHPEWGAALLDELGGFSPRVRRLVLDHHERIDGAGYPTGRGGHELALETRILTVCDVYDALVSERVYRAAWSSDRALGLLKGEAGEVFDSACVAALEQVVGREAARTAPATVPPLPAAVPVSGT